MPISRDGGSDHATERCHRAFLLTSEEVAILTCHSLEETQVCFAFWNPDIFPVVHEQNVPLSSIRARRRGTVLN